jgi:hypothetical protein
MDYYEESWGWVGKGIGVTRQGINTYGTYRPTGPTPNMSQASLSLYGLGTLGAPLSMKAAFDDSQAFARAQAIHDREGIVTSGVSFGLNTGSVVDAGLTVSAVAAEVSANPALAPLSWAVLPFGIAMTAVATAVEGLRTYNVYALRRELEEFIPATADFPDEEDPGHGLVREGLLIYLRKRFRETPHDRVRYHYEIRQEHPHWSTEQVWTAHRQRIESKRQRLEAAVVRRSSQDVADRMKDLLWLLERKEPAATIEEIAECLDRVNLAKTLLWRQALIGAGQVTSNMLIGAGLCTFYLAGVAPYVPFGFLAAGGGLKLGLYTYQYFFLRKSLEALAHGLDEETMREVGAGTTQGAVPAWEDW